MSAFSAAIRVALVKVLTCTWKFVFWRTGVFQELLSMKKKTKTICHCRYFNFPRDVRSNNSCGYTRLLPEVTPVCDTCRLQTADLQTADLQTCRLADLQTFVTNWKDYKFVLHWSEQRVLWSVLHDRVDNTLRSPLYILRDKVAWHKETLKIWHLLRVAPPFHFNIRHTIYCYWELEFESPR